MSSELRCEVVDAPEKKLWMDARDRGLLVHEVLEEFVGGMIEATDSDGLARAESLERLHEIANVALDRAERFGKTGPKALWSRSRRELLHVLEREREHDLERRHVEGTTPLLVEWRFGGESSPTIALRDGQALAFHGTVDRIDRRADGGLSVIDYKTGRSRFYDGLGEDPLDGGRHLQLAVYALAARAGVTGAGEVPIRALYRFLEEDGEEIAVDLDSQLVGRTEAVLGVIAAGIEAGLFPYNPGEANWQTFSHCRICDFNDVCPTDRDDCWEIARSAPELAAYVTLSDGEPGDD